MPASTLKAMATRAAQKHIKEVEDLGEMPHNLAAPILDAVYDAAHLLKLQTNSPHLVTITSDKWMELIKRDIPSWSRDKIIPKDPKLWWKVYRKVKRDDEALKAAAEAKLRQDLSELAAKRVEQRTHFVPDLVLPSSYKSRFAQTTTSRPSKPAKARSSIMNAVLKGASAHRIERRVPSTVKAPAKPLKHDGIERVSASKVTEAFGAYYNEHKKELQKARRVEKDAVVSSITGCKKPLPTTYTGTMRRSRTPTPPARVLTPIDDPLGLFGPPTQSSSSTAPVAPTPQLVKQAPKRALPSITRPAKRTRFS